MWGFSGFEVLLFFLGFGVVLIVIIEGFLERREKKRFLEFKFFYIKFMEVFFMFLLFVIIKFIIVFRFLRYGRFSRGYSVRFRRFDSKIMCSKVKIGEKILLNKYEGLVV